MSASFSRFMAIGLGLGAMLSAAWGDSLPAESAPSKPISFNRDVRPILSDRCFACHGPDEKKREAELRLDTFEGATAPRDAIAIVPGEAKASEVIRRVTSEDADALMPPPASHKPKLTSAEVEILKRWIDQGAPYEKHWAFQPISRPDPSNFSDLPTGAHPIDRFITASLQEQRAGKLSPRTTKERLIRRVTLDLTGLPPARADVEAFVADESPNAFERVVDRLLQSPAFGERIATEWLDAARFADTHGYQMDRDRPVWPYRDWVIRALNSNLPFDQFVRWQLAGDLLPQATKDQRLATAFQRLHSQNEEGGIVEEEFRVAYVVDRVTTFGTVFLGLTFECSRCHDHKYDPITMKEFYSLFSFFQNINEPGQTSYFTPDMPTPAMLLSTDEQDAEIARQRAAVAEQEKELASIDDRAGFETWLRNRPPQVNLPGKQAEFRFESIEGNKVTNEVDVTKPGSAIDAPVLVDGPPGHGRATQLTGDNGYEFPSIGHFHRAEPFSISIWVKQPTPSHRAVVLHHSRAPADAASRGYDLLLEDGRIAFGLYYMWPGSAVKVRSQNIITPDAWTHLAATYDGSGRAEGMHLYINGVRSPVEVVVDQLTKDITYAGAEPNLAIGYRFRDNGFKNGSVDDLSLFARVLTPLEVAHLAGKPDFETAWREPDPSGRTREDLYTYYLSTESMAWKTAAGQLLAARDQLRKLLAPIPELMVMDEMPEPKPAFVLKRGNYDQPGDPVTAGTPAALPPFPTGSPRNRLGLADWLLDPEHPLMARVTVNRFWQMLFGRGLVETSDNFGLQGSLPTHPELLDWLARDFVDHGWDLKRWLKQVVLSETYQQDSRAPAWAKEHDAENRWLSHAPARTLTSEMLRDQALLVSGLLTPKIGGPSVMPYQPDGLWAIAMGYPQYKQSQGADLYRRSLYTYWKRTVPPPTMMTLDGADRSYCTVRRQSTNTPLQALVLLNDPQFVEAARVAAERMLTEGGSDPVQQVRWLFQSATSRPATERETDLLVRLLNEQKEVFASDPAAAKKLLAVGEKKAAENLDPVELAAAAVVAQAVFNHDEFTKRR